VPGTHVGQGLEVLERGLFGNRGVGVGPGLDGLLGTERMQCHDSTRSRYLIWQRASQWTFCIQIMKTLLMMIRIIYISNRKKCFLDFKWTLESAMGLGCLSPRSLNQMVRDQNAPGLLSFPRMGMSTAGILGSTGSVD
jgi:hypothetical protein